MLILDEAHEIYDEPAWWTNFKADAKRRKCAVLVFATYGLDRLGAVLTPVDFLERFNFADLTFTRSEFDECVKWQNILERVFCHFCYLNSKR